MNSFRLLCVALLFGLSQFAIAETTLRVLTYNIHHSAGMDGVIDLKRIANVIQSVKPDIVALQEVDRRTTRVGGVDQAQVLADLTGMHMAFGKAIDFSGGQYGNVVLSRFPLGDITVHLLPKSENHEQRVFLQTDIDVAKDTPLTFIATHLDHASAVDRMAAVGVMEDLLPKLTNPVLFAGDMNAVPDSDVMKRLMKHFASAILDQPLLTIPVDEPKRQIDYILYYPKTQWKTVHAEVLNEAVASDHRALFAIIEFVVE